MARVIVEPVTRIEGHAQVTIALDARGRVRDARVGVTALRGIEAICVGRPIEQMPALTSRVCGICPVAHSLAAAKAGDEILGVSPPPAAVALRRLVLLGSLVQSHATSFFHLAAPDLVLGPGAPLETRNVFGVAAAAPELAQDGVLLRRFGQEVVERTAGRRVHPIFTVPGGVARPLDPGARDLIAAAVPGALDAVERSLAWWSEQTSRWRDEGVFCGDAPTLSLGQVTADGALEHADGIYCAVSASGAIVDDGLSPAECLRRIEERAVPWSYAKLCVWRDPAGHAHAYRVGPLARLTVASRCGTPRADRALAELRRLGDHALRSNFHGHLARLIEVVFAIERISELLASGDILSRDVLERPSAHRAEGVGACEAPRGSLFHRYTTDENGIVTSANLVVATGQNGRAMNAAVHQVARSVAFGRRVTQELCDRVEATVRAFDPCMSCATHTVGERSVRLRLVGPDGETLDEWPPAE